MVKWRNDHLEKKNHCRGILLCWSSISPFLRKGSAPHFSIPEKFFPSNTQVLVGPLILKPHLWPQRWHMPKTSQSEAFKVEREEGGQRLRNVSGASTPLRDTRREAAQFIKHQSTEGPFARNQVFLFHMNPFAKIVFLGTLYKVY